MQLPTIGNVSYAVPALIEGYDIMLAIPHGRETESVTPR